MSGCAVPQSSFDWRSEKVGVQEIRRGQKNGRIENILFSLIFVCLGGLKSGEMEKTFVWLRRKIKVQKILSV